MLAHTVRIHKTRFLDGKDDGRQARIGESPQTAQVTARRPHIFSHLFIYKNFFWRKLFQKESCLVPVLFIKLLPIAQMVETWDQGF
jgi:hypothetical protein